MCQEGCVYNGFDRDKNKVKCDCNNNYNNQKNKEFKNEVNNLFSNSNLKVLKCLYLNNNYKILIKNYVFFVNLGKLLCCLMFYSKVFIL